MPKPPDRSSQRTAAVAPARREAPLWNSRGTVVIIGAAVTLAIVLVYSGPAASVVLLRLITDGLYLLAWLLAALGLGALVIEWRGPACPSRTVPMVGLMYVVTASALGLGVMSLSTLGLGLAGLLTRATAFGLLALGILAGALAIVLHRRRRKSARENPGHEEFASAWWRGRAGWAWAGLVVAPWLALAVVGTMMVPGLLWKPGEPHGYDVVEYHLQVAREWYEAGRIAPLRHNAFSFFPFNVEMHYLLAMHLEGGPYEGMYLCQLMHLAMMALVVLAAWAFARRVAASRTAAVLAGVALAIVPWFTQLAAIAYNEGGFLLYSTLAVGWAMLAICEPEGRLRKFVIAGVMAGLACGAKLTAVPEVLIGVPVVAGVVLLWGRRARRGETGAPGRLRRDLAGPVLFVAAGLVAFAPWLVRNQVWTGNPVFPEAASVLGRAYFSDLQVERWHRAHSPQPEQRPVGARLRAFAAEVLRSWQFAYVLVPLGVAGMLVALRRPEGLFLGGMLLLLTVFWLGFTHLQGRFYLLAVPVCAIAAAQIEWRRAWLPAALLVVVVAASVPGWVRIHRTILTRLYGEPGSPIGGMVSVLGGPLNPTENVSWITIDSMEKVPPGARLLLVGDAKAFWYPIPMSRLRYRTVFDADTSDARGIDAAWGVTAAREAGEWVLIDPQELERLEQTYQPFPPIPAEWTAQPAWAAGHPFLLPPLQSQNTATSRSSAPVR